jgi:hypothetical protein
MKLDQYTLRARVAPALITALPAALVVLAFAPSGWGVLWSVITEAGGATLLASLARHAGRTKQPKLFQLWGGRPSDRLLSHRHAPNKVTLQRRHAQLQALMPNVGIPTAAEEEQDPAAAAEVYESCIDFLRGKTRDHAKFTLILEENCNYGFARNIWGLRDVGLLIALTGTITLGGRVFLFMSTHRPVEMSLVVLTAINISLLLLWSFWFTPSWVKGPADAYGNALIESLDTLV